MGVGGSGGGPGGGGWGGVLEPGASLPTGKGVLNVYMYEEICIYNLFLLSSCYRVGQYSNCGGVVSPHSENRTLADFSKGGCSNVLFVSGILSCLIGCPTALSP